jgi:hypothetical protein
MSKNYDKYKKKTPEQLQRAIDERIVTTEYLDWLGIVGPGAQLRNQKREQDNA